MRKTILGKRRLQQIAKEEANKQISLLNQICPVPTPHHQNCSPVEEYDTDLPPRYVTNNNCNSIVLSSVENPSKTEPEDDCKQILQSIIEWKVKNSVNQHQFTSLLKILKPHPCFSKFPSDCRSLLVIQEKPQIRHLLPGEFVYFSVLRNIKLCKKLTNPHNIQLQINVDGLPLFRSSSIQFWPILGTFVGVSKRPFVIAIFSGNKKPDLADDLLKDFVEELTTINANSEYNVTLHSVICDAPAKSFVKGVKGHTGYHGCDRCIVEGDYVDHRMTFGSNVKELRTDLSFRSRKDEDHHIRDTILKSIPSFDLVLGFPQDYMHLICLGVVKKLLHLWTSGKPSQEKLRSSQILIISQKLSELSNKVVCEFSRKPRRLDDLERFKATEFRQFLLYTGPIVLKNVVTPQSYELCMSLSVAIGILVSDKFNLSLNSYANDLLQFFVKKFEALFGRQQVSYNVHCVLHLAADARRLGPLDSFSAFQYESKLGTLKKLIRSSYKPLQQVVNRICESDLVENIEESYDCPSIVTSKEHFLGPVIESLVGPQYHQILINGQYTLKCSVIRDSYFLTNKKVLASVVNICYSESLKEQVLLARTQNSSRNLFYNPCDSSNLNIFVFDYFTDSGFSVIRLREILSKVQVFDIGDGLAVFPLHH